MNDAAVEQIRQLSSTSGAIQLQGVTEKNGHTLLAVSLDTRGIEHRAGGIRVRPREVFNFVVPPDFPFTPPSVHATHARWAGTAHVQWSNHICIYAAPSAEWVPADGMRGLVDRLMLWLERAALGSLDPEGQPLHPPVAYPAADAGHLVVRTDLGDRVPWESRGESTKVLFAWCVVIDENRADVLDWLTLDEVIARVTAEGFSPTDAEGRRWFTAVAAFISEQIAFEYPDKARALLDALGRSGLATDVLLKGLSKSRVVNKVLEAHLPDENALPNIVILGTPSRRIETARLAHLSAWQLEEVGDTLADLLRAADWGVLKDDKDEIYDLAHQWLDLASIAWKRVWEDRPEVTRSRDNDTAAASLLRGKRVLLLGCGALGGPIGEHCVRAGVSTLTVVDNGRVSPGILVRQPYGDADVTKPKATVLAARLGNIRSDVTVSGVFGDAKRAVEPSDAFEGYDLVIDATADIGVRSVIEVRRTASRQQWPHVLSVMIGHDAKVGVVSASSRGVSGGPVDVLRRFSLACLSTPTLQDIADDFFPKEPRGDLFFPEPGCSSPTFTGSHADVTTLAGMLLNEGAGLLAQPNAQMGAAAVRRNSQKRTAVHSHSWRSDLIIDDANLTGYEVRLSEAALTEMRAEARRGRRIRGRLVETGGMLLGAIDDACRIVHVDRAVGPPPDSRLSEVYFQHGTRGTQEMVDECRQATRERQSFVGLWHSHPEGPASPSETDDEGMWEIVNIHGIGRRALMIIVGGSTWEQWLQDGTEPALYARVSTLGKSTRPGPGASVRNAPDQSFPGGFAYPVGFHTEPGRSAS